MKMTKGVSKYIIALALLIFSFTGTVSMLSEIVITASAAMTAEQFISSGYDNYQTEIFTGDGEIHLNGKVYSSGIKSCEELAEKLFKEKDPYGSGLYAELLLRRCESEDIADQAIEIAKSAKVGKDAYFADDDEKDRFIQACNQKKDEILYKSKSPELKKYLKKTHRKGKKSAASNKSI